MTGKQDSYVTFDQGLLGPRWTEVKGERADAVSGAFSSWSAAGLPGGAKAAATGGAMSGAVGTASRDEAKMADFVTKNLRNEEVEALYAAGHGDAVEEAFSKSSDKARGKRAGKATGELQRQARRQRHADRWMRRQPEGRLGRGVDALKSRTFQKASAAAKQAATAQAEAGDDLAGQASSGVKGTQRGKAMMALTARGRAATAGYAAVAATGDANLSRLVQGGQAAARTANAAVRAADRIKARYAKNKSMAIAKALKECKLVSPWQGVAIAAKSATKALASAAAAAVGSLLLPLLGLLLILLMVFALVSCSAGGAANEEKSGYGNLGEVESEVAAYLTNIGYSSEATAAVLGNMYWESGMNPASDGPDGAGGRALGLLQYDQGSGERQAFLDWCSANGKQWDTVAAQMEWSFSGEPGTSSFKQRWTIRKGYYAVSEGYEARFDRDFHVTAQDFMAATGDVDLSTFSWMACYEGPSARLCHLDKRIEKAREYLSQILTPKQQAIVDACKTVPSPGAGLCAMWVSQVYEAAGLGYVGGNANDMYARWCTSSDRSELRPGMIVAVSRHGSTSAGRIYGHVAIYIGNGQVMENVGYVNTQSLDKWLADYGDLVTPKWGFAAAMD